VTQSDCHGCGGLREKQFSRELVTQSDFHACGGLREKQFPRELVRQSEFDGCGGLRAGSQQTCRGPQAKFEAYLG